MFFKSFRGFSSRRLKGFFHVFLVTAPDYKLVAEKKMCEGTRLSMRISTIDVCSESCRSKASMFIYGVAPGGCRRVDYCECQCMTSSKDGQCTMKDHRDFNLYAYSLDKTGEIGILFSLY